MLVLIAAIILIVLLGRSATEKKYKELESEVSRRLGIYSGSVSYYDEYVTVKSRQTLDKYDEVKYFKDDRERLERTKNVLIRKNDVTRTLKKFLADNEYKSNPQYKRLENHLQEILRNASAYRINVAYISSAGNRLAEKTIGVTQYDLNRFYQDPSLLMGKGEYNKLLKEQQKEALIKKHRAFYNRVNTLIEYANEKREDLVIKGSQAQLDRLIGQLFDRTVNSIKKIKTTDSEEWEIIDDFITHLDDEIKKITNKNQRILEYYDSPDFAKVKDTCESLMSSQREFNEYINEKVQSISQLFGTKIVRSETINEDEYDYVRPYKKAITPFTAEVSAAVFASAENRPLEYVVKHFYPNKVLYPDQIQKLYLLVEELETLKDAKQIIENYKAEYQQYLGDVPNFVMENDEAGFYSRLGFANIDESVLAVEYKFTYTSGGGMAQRSFAIPMNEETIAELIKVLESKLTASAFAKEQRTLMTQKLRTFIKTRDNFTCCICGNSTQAEPNLLLEIDHIIPVAKGGCTTEENLQTLCWKCNRSKGSKVL